MSAAPEIADRLPLVEEILGAWRARLGPDFEGYRNHVYRMINFCFAQGDFAAAAREKIVIAGCFHDLGIWSANSFDYLPPSCALAAEYLRGAARPEWTAEIEAMIGEHHRVRAARDPLVEAFRRGDLVDFSLGLVRCGLPKSYVGAVKKRFPNAGFHKCLARVAAGWIVRHPLNPVPVLKF